MGRPRKEDATDTRGAILTVAVELFGRHGRDGASIRAIAEGAGVSMSTLFHHFGDKGCLFNACVHATYAKLDGLAERFGKAISGAGTARDALRPAIRESLSFSFENRAFIRVIVASAVTTGHVPVDVQDAITSPGVALIAPLLASLSGRSTAEMKVLAMSFNHIVSRYVVMDRAALIAILGVDTALDDAAQDMACQTVLEDHLVALFGPQLG